MNTLQELSDSFNKHVGGVAKSNDEQLAEQLFEERFNRHMNGNVADFKNSYSTLYRKVVLPLITDLIRSSQNGSTIK